MFAIFNVRHHVVRDQEPSSITYGTRRQISELCSYRSSKGQKRDLREDHFLGGNALLSEGKRNDVVILIAVNV
jgi:hypothetical protein